MNSTESYQSLDLDTFAAIDAAELAQPFTDDPDVVGSEVDKVKRLADDKAHFRTPIIRTVADLRAKPEAVRHLERLPVPGESMHAVISGKFALWDLVPAILERTGQDIDHLHLATLGFSTSNASEILTLLDAGKIKRVNLLVSHYFKGTSPEIYDALVPKLIERGHPVLAMRTHCKLILAAMSDGTRYVVESSANLRSCQNIEQFVMTNDHDLYEFHRGWIDGELFGGQQ